MSAARALPTLKRDVLLGMVGGVMALLVASMVLGGIESATVALSLGISIIGCIVALHWLVGGRP